MPEINERKIRLLHSIFPEKYKHPDKDHVCNVMESKVCNPRD